MAPSDSDSDCDLADMESLSKAQECYDEANHVLQFWEIVRQQPQGHFNCIISGVELHLPRDEEGLRGTVQYFKEQIEKLRPTDLGE